MRIHTPTANAVPSTLPSKAELPPKAELRDAARRRRATLQTNDFAARLAAYADALRVAPGAVVACYHAHRDEADPALLLQALAAAGAHVAFPRVSAKGEALEFHLVPDGEVLHPGAYGILEPLAHWPRAIPDILLVPLLAFDPHGTRLGYGGGYYDRTLAALPRVRAVGIAYAGQGMDILPRDAHDYPLHAVLTETGLTEFPR
jgi:5-formyltetrahydrofolate cyclo-ligase